MGNAIEIMDNKSDNEKLEYLRSEGLLNDEMITLYREGNMTLQEITNYIANNKIK